MRCVAPGLAVVCALLASTGTRAESLPREGLVEEAVEGRVAAPATAVCGTLRALESFPRWFPGIVGWQFLSGDARDPVSAEVRVHGRQHGPGPLRDRDYVVRYRMTTPEPGHCTLTATAEAAALPPPADDVVRIDRLESTWTVRPEGDASHVRYAVVGEPGPLPAWARPERWRSASPRLLEALEAEVGSRSAGSDS